MRSSETATHPAAWVGAALFAISIACFLFTYALTFAGQPSQPSHGADAAVNLLLFGIFALHHSVFARTPVRRGVAGMVPAGLERTFYVAVASILLIVVCFGWRLLSGTLWQVEGVGRWLLHAVQLAGVVIIVCSVRIVNARELAGLAPVSPAQTDLQARGPYGWIRHPIYAGWLLVTFAVPLMTATRLAFAAAAAVYLLVAIPLEEGTLRRTAPEPFRRYAARVRWKLLPGVWLFVVILLGQTFELPRIEFE